MTGDSWPPPPDWWIDGTDPPDVDPFSPEATAIPPDNQQPPPDAQNRA